jgi:hypothetical protein
MAMKEHRVSSWSTGAVMSLILCLILALVMRVPHFEDALTADEVWMLAGSAGHGRDIAFYWKKDVLQEGFGNPTALENARGIPEIWQNNVAGHPPLHALTLRLWREVFGGTDEVARAYSSAWSLLTVWMIFASLRLQFNTAVATCASILYALSPLQIHLGTEIRSYAMVIAFLSIAAWLMVRMETLGASRGQVWSLGLLTLPMMLSHYLAMGPCLAIALWGTWRLRRFMRMEFMISLAISACLFLVLWMPFAGEDFSGFSGDGNQWLISSDTMNRLKSVAGLPVLLLITNNVAKVTTINGARLLGILSIALLAIVGYGCFKDRRIHVWSLLLFIPAIVLLGIDLLGGTEMVRWSRYGSFATLGIIAAPIASGFAIHKRFGWFLAGLLILSMVPFTGLERDLGSPRHDHMIHAFSSVVLRYPVKLPLASINVSIDSGALGQGWDASMIHWYRLPGFLPRSTLVLSEKPDPNVLDILRKSTPNSQFWLTSYGACSEQQSNHSSAWMRYRLPGIHPLKGPWIVAGGQGIRSERPPMCLQLMKFNNSSL